MREPGWAIRELEDAVHEDEPVLEAPPTALPVTLTVVALAAIILLVSLTPITL